MSKKDTPNFETWDHATLARYAQEQYLQNLELREALEQVRLDFKDAMNQLRRKQ